MGKRSFTVFALVAFAFLPSCAAAGDEKTEKLEVPAQEQVETVTTAASACEAVAEVDERLSAALEGDLGMTAQQDALAQLADSIGASLDHSDVLPEVVAALTQEDGVDTYHRVLKYCDGANSGVEIRYDELVSLDQLNSGCETVVNEILGVTGSERTDSQHVADERRLADIIEQDLAPWTNADLSVLVDDIRSWADSIESIGFMEAFAQNGSVDFEVLDELCHWGEPGL